MHVIKAEHADVCIGGVLCQRDESAQVLGRAPRAWFGRRADGMRSRAQVFGLGFTSVFEQVLEGLAEADKEAIFASYIHALDEDPALYKKVRRWLARRRTRACGTARAIESMLTIDNATEARAGAQLCGFWEQARWGVSAEGRPLYCIYAKTEFTRCWQWRQRDPVQQARVVGSTVLRARPLRREPGRLSVAGLSFRCRGEHARSCLHPMYMYCRAVHCGAVYIRAEVHARRCGQDAKKMEAWASGLGSPEALKPADDGDEVQKELAAIAARSAAGDFLYTKFFAIGLFRLLELTGAKDPKALEALVRAVGAPPDSVNRDLMTYKARRRPSQAARALGLGVPGVGGNMLLALCAVWVLPALASAQLRSTRRASTQETDDSLP